MEYNKKIWQDKDIITRQALNNIEEGIDNLYKEVPNFALKEEVPSIEGLASEKFVNDAIEAIEHPQYDDTEIREKINAIEIPSVEGLASEVFVLEQINAIEHPQYDDTEIKEKINELASIQFVEDKVAESHAALATRTELHQLVGEQIGNINNVLTAEIGNMHRALTTEVDNINNRITNEINNVHNTFAAEISNINAILTEQVRVINDEHGDHIVRLHTRINELEQDIEDLLLVIEELKNK